MKCKLPEEYTKAKVNSNIKLSMYDLNKQIISQMEPISEKEKTEHFCEMFSTFRENTNDNYYMLLCRDINYYTLFHRNYGQDLERFSDVVEEIIDNQGTWITANWANEETKNAIEYWIKVKQPTEEEPNKEEIYCFILFPYDIGVVEVD